MVRFRGFNGQLKRYSSFIDPFDASEPNPTLTNELESSLWELYTQKNHYHSAVSTLARIFEEAFTKPNYALEDFLDHTYSTVCVAFSYRSIQLVITRVICQMYETEARRKIRKEPAVVFDLPQQTWFPSSTASEDVELDRAASLWTFS